MKSYLDAHYRAQDHLQRAVAWREYAERIPTDRPEEWERARAWYTYHYHMAQQEEGRGYDEYTARMWKSPWFWIFATAAGVALGAFLIHLGG